MKLVQALRSRNNRKSVRAYYLGMAVIVTAKFILFLTESDSFAYRP